MNFNETGVVKAICISPARGTEKHTISEGHFIPDFGKYWLVEQYRHWKV